MSVLRRGCWGQLQRVKRGGGSAQLEPHQTLPATLSSQNSSSLWLQSRFSALQPGPAQRRPLGVWTSPSPPPRFTPGGNIREKQTQPLLLSLLCIGFGPRAQRTDTRNRCQLLPAPRGRRPELPEEGREGLQGNCINQQATGSLWEGLLERTKTASSCTWCSQWKTKE